MMFVSFVNEFHALEERSLHTGEVEGSIPSAPTIKSAVFSDFSNSAIDALGNSKQNEARKRHSQTWRIRGLRSRGVPRSISNLKCANYHLEGAAYRVSFSKPGEMNALFILNRHCQFHSDNKRIC
jgi:hypothetical protein